MGKFKNTFKISVIVQCSDEGAYNLLDNKNLKSALKEVNKDLKGIAKIFKPIVTKVK